MLPYEGGQFVELLGAAGWTARQGQLEHIRENMRTTMMNIPELSTGGVTTSSCWMLVSRSRDATSCRRFCAYTVILNVGSSIAVNTKTANSVASLTNLLVLKVVHHQQWQRISNKVELVWSDALAAVGCDGQGVPLSVDAEELQVQQAVSEPPCEQDMKTVLLSVIVADRQDNLRGKTKKDTYSLQNGFAGGQGLLCYVNELDNLQLHTPRKTGIASTTTAEERGSASIIYAYTHRTAENDAGTHETDQSGHHTLDGESTECFLVAHHQQLAHLDGSLELLGLVACGLKTLQELLSLGAWTQVGGGGYSELTKREEN
ncbi:hypothetical protein F7725_021073 [Dissostichus mawsoni]|uniref:Uncharacterized protein n=1 Tax=Dissostichus mawsoni TaxID=36200 RepID=A0A7J5YF32_DISMA|nr:hypothetical protein F7725_021073 [Dissostichus mawsoni]